jgi:hypothetical protein
MEDCPGEDVCVIGYPDGDSGNGEGGTGGSGGTIGCSATNPFEKVAGNCQASGGRRPPGPPPIITISHLSTTSKKAIAVQNDLRWLEAAIDQDPTCAKWLAGADLAINFMLNAPGGGATAMMVGVGSFSDVTVNAVASASGTNLAPGSMVITVNTNGAFFDSGPNSSVGFDVPSWITGGTPAAQAEILLHELAHNVGAAGFNQNDYNNPVAEGENNVKVMQNCGNIVNLLGDH